MEGIIIIDKPKGFTSQDVVSKVKRILNIKKARTCWNIRSFSDRSSTCNAWKLY
jgi:hypothetical protein